MDSETQEVLQEAAAADRQVAAKGAIRFTKPVDIGAGRIVMQLDDSAAPKAAQNFRCLCTGERGLGKTSKKVSQVPQPTRSCFCICYLGAKNLAELRQHKQES